MTDMRDRLASRLKLGTATPKEWIAQVDLRDQMIRRLQEKVKLLVDGLNAECKCGPCADTSHTDCSCVPLCEPCAVRDKASRI